MLLVIFLLLITGLGGLDAFIQAHNKSVIIAEVPGMLFLLPLFGIVEMMNLFFYAVDAERYVCFGRIALFGYCSSVSLMY